MYTTRLGDHVNIFFSPKIQKDLEVGGWVKCPIGYKKKLKTYFYTLFYYVFGQALERQ